jgi:hypothetical protein
MMAAVFLTLKCPLFAQGEKASPKVDKNSEAAASVQSKIAAWRLGVSLGLGIALRDAGAEDEAKRYFGMADGLARALGLGALNVPEKKENKAKSSARMLGYILQDEQKLAFNLTHKYGAPHAATYTAGVKTMLFLLLYSAEGKEMNQNLMHGTEDAAHAAQIPIELWEPLFKLIRNSASYSDVKGEVLMMEEKVEAALEK